MLGHNGKYRLVIVVGKVIKVGIDGSEWLVSQNGGYRWVRVAGKSEWWV